MFGYEWLPNGELKCLEAQPMIINRIVLHVSALEKSSSVGNSWRKESYKAVEFTYFAAIGIFHKGRTLVITVLKIRLSNGFLK